MKKKKLFRNEPGTVSPLPLCHKSIHWTETEEIQPQTVALYKGKN